MNAQCELLRVLDESLSLGSQASAYMPQTQLLGSAPELDSIAVVTASTRPEDRCGIVVENDDIDGSTFATVGSVVKFVNGELVA